MFDIKIISRAIADIFTHALSDNSVNHSNHNPGKSRSFTKKGPVRTHKYGKPTAERRLERKLRSCSR